MIRSAVVAAFLVPAVLSAAESAVVPLAPNETVERSIAGGENYSFAFDVPAQTAARLIVRQGGADVRLSVRPAGATAPVATINMSNGIGGEEEYRAPVAAAPQSFVVAIEPVLADAARGSITIGLDQTAARPPDSSLAEVHTQFQKAWALHHSGKGTSIRESIGIYDEIAAKAASDQRLAAEAIYQSALAADLVSETPDAVARLKRVQPLFDEIGPAGRRARVLDRLGDLARKTGDIIESGKLLDDALDLARQSSDIETEADVLNNHGLLLSSIGRWEEAVAMLERAIPFAARTKSLDVESALHHNVGQALAAMGDHDGAIEAYQRSLALKRRMGIGRRIARTLNNLAAVYYSAGDKEKALATINEALQLWEASGDRPGTAASLGWLGRMQHDAGDDAAATATLARALPAFVEVGDRRGESAVLTASAEIDLDCRCGRNDAAIEKLDRAIELARQTADRVAEARALSIRATALREQGKIDAAVDSAAAAVDIVETTGGAIRAHELRESYLAKVRRYYDRLIALLVERGAPGDAARAFTASERSRARTLLESLAESAAKVRKGIDPALAARERDLQAELNAKERYRVEVEKRGDKAASAAAAGDVNRLLEEWRALQTAIRTSNPAWAALNLPQPLAVTAVQSYLDADTVLLEYHLGANRSQVWVVGKERVSVHDLDPAPAIRDAARAYHELVAEDAGSLDAARRSQRRTALRKSGEELARRVLDPVRDEIRGKRLVIVADGALQYVPFAALPESAGKPLIESHEVVYLPSASVLQTLRQSDRSGSRAIAVFADPVFSADDPRLSAAAVPSVASRSRGVAADRSRSFPRLRFSRSEAKAIVVAATGRRTFEAMDFEAAKRTLAGADLKRYGILHFATHATLDTERPELSGLVLSLYDKRGKPVDGFLRLHEIYNLDLDARLVVLSACNTALGREMNGEGLIGLTRGFLYAGSSRVVSTLWNIDDRASALLMSRFYAAMLGRGLAPAAALREAQLKMLRERNWSDPHDWAAFGLNGTWK